MHNRYFAEFIAKLSNIKCLVCEMKIGTQSSVHCFEELIIFYIPGWLSN